MKMINKGEIQDSKTISGLFMAQRWLKKQIKAKHSKLLLIPFQKAPMPV